MPAVSKAQNRWAYANADKPGKLGKAAREFELHGKGATKGLPERKGKKPSAKHRESLGAKHSPGNSRSDMKRMLDGLD